MVVGTPEYMAPEQGRNPDQATSASDVWSLGATLVYLMTGEPPFAGSTVIDLIVRTVVDPLALPEDFPEDLTALLEVLMAKSPDERPQDGQAVVNLLQRLGEGRFPLQAPAVPATALPVKKPVPIRPVASPLKRRPPARRRPH